MQSMSILICLTWGIFSIMFCFHAIYLGLNLIIGKYMVVMSYHRFTFMNHIQCGMSHGHWLDEIDINENWQFVSWVWTIYFLHSGFKLVFSMSMLVNWLVHLMFINPAYDSYLCVHALRDMGSNPNITFMWQLLYDAKYLFIKIHRLWFDLLQMVLFLWI